VLLDVFHLSSAVGARTEQTTYHAALVPGIPNTGIGCIPIRDVLIEDPDRRVGAHDLYSHEDTFVQRRILALQAVSQRGTQPIATELAPWADIDPFRLAAGGFAQSPSLVEGPCLNPQLSPEEFIASGSEEPSYHGPPAPL
jgi:hypothetical protein